MSARPLSRRRASALVTGLIAIFAAVLVVFTGSSNFFAQAAPAPDPGAGGSAPQAQGSEAFGLSSGCLKNGVFVPLGGACGDATQLSDPCQYSQEMCEKGSGGYGECSAQVHNTLQGTICKQGSGCTPNSLCDGAGHCVDYDPVTCPPDTECVQYGCSTTPGAPCVVIKQQPAVDAVCVEKADPIICGQKYWVIVTQVSPPKCEGRKCRESYMLDGPPCPSVDCQYTYEKPAVLPSCGTGTYQETLKITRNAEWGGAPCPTALTRDVSYSLAPCTQNSTCVLTGLTGQTVDYGINVAWGEQAYAEGTTTRLDGTWSFKEGSTAVGGSGALSVGPHTITADFTPKDPLYKPTTCSGSFTVKKAATRCELTGATPVRSGSAVSFGAQGYVRTTLLDGSFSFSENGSAVRDNSALMVGSHTIIANFTPSDLTNYEKSTCQKTFDVNDLIATTCSWASPAALVYGAALPADMFDPTKAAGPKGSVAGSVTGFSHSAGQKLPAGSTVVTATFNPTDGAYSTSNCATTVTVNKKAVSCTVQNKSRPYGDLNPELTFSCDGWVGSDTTASVFGSTVPTTTATILSSAGSYPITLKAPSSSTAANYDIAITNATLTITQRAAQCSADSKTMTVGDAVPALTHSCSGLVNGDTVAIFGDPASLLFVDGSTTTAGKPPIRYRNNPGVTHINYQVKTTDGILTINSRALLPTRCEVTVSSVMYGTGLPLSAKAFDGASNPVAGTFTYSINGKAVNPGDILDWSDGYTVTATFTPNLSTYAGAQCSGWFAVARPTVNCIADSARRPYGTALDKPLGFKCYLGETQITSGISGGSLSAVPAIDALPTNYKITFTSEPTIPNYIVTTTPGWVTVDPAGTTCQLKGLTGQTVAYGTYVDTMPKGYIGSTTTELTGSFLFKDGSTSLPSGSNGIFQAGTVLSVGTHTITADFSPNLAGAYSNSQCSGTVTVSGCLSSTQCTVDDNNACTTNTCCTATSCSVGGVTIPNGQCYNKPITSTVGTMKPSLTLTCPTDGAKTGEVKFTWTDNATCMNPAPTYRILASSVATPVFSPTPGPSDALDTTETRAACTAGTCVVTRSIPASHFSSNKTIYGSVAIYTQTGYNQSESVSKAASCAWCGDGVINGSEQCDGTKLPADKTAAMGYRCNACKLEQCGDGIINGAEQCDGSAFPADKTAAMGYRCNACKLERCGDGVINGTEQCDGTTFPADRTAAMGYRCNSCKLEYCGDAVINGSEQCDGTTFPADKTAAMGYRCFLCKLERCGDGIRNGTEICDGEWYCSPNCLKKVVCATTPLTLQPTQVYDKNFIGQGIYISEPAPRPGGDWTFTYANATPINYQDRTSGTRVIYGSFKPTLANEYESVSCQTTIDIKAATSSCTISSPTVNAGQAVTHAMFIPTKSVDGTLTFFNNSNNAPLLDNSILPSGTYSITATLQPTDSRAYTSSVCTGTLTVKVPEAVTCGTLPLTLGSNQTYNEAFVKGGFMITSPAPEPSGTWSFKVGGSAINYASRPTTKITVDGAFSPSSAQYQSTTCSTTITPQQCQDKPVGCCWTDYGGEYVECSANGVHKIEDLINSTNCSGQTGTARQSCLKTLLSKQVCQALTGDPSSTTTAPTIECQSVGGMANSQSGFTCSSFPLTNGPECSTTGPGTGSGTGPTCGNGVLDPGETCDIGNGGSAGCVPGAKCVGCKLDTASGGCKTLVGVKCGERDASGNVSCTITSAWGPNAVGVWYDGTTTDCADSDCCPGEGTDTAPSTDSFGAGRCMPFTSMCPKNKGALLDPPSFYFTHSPSFTTYNDQWINYFKYRCISPGDTLDLACQSQN